MIESVFHKLRMLFWGPESAQLYANAGKFYAEGNALRNLVMDLAKRRHTLTEDDWRRAVDQSMVPGMPPRILAAFHRQLGLSDPS
jgi:hypothetical protein